MIVKRFHDIGLEFQKRQTGAGALLGKLMVEHFPELMKNIYSDIQNAYQFSNRIN